MRVEPIKKLTKILATLAMLFIIFLTLVMPAQAEQSDVESPTANFFAFSTSGDAPFDTAFMDTSTGNPTEWYWEFGDGATSTKQDPDHTYSDPGSYTVILTATNDAGSDEVTKAGYIKVKGSTTNTESTEDVDFTTDTDSTTYIESTKEDDSTNDIEPTVDTVEKPVAGFDAYVPSGTAPFHVVFLDESKGEPTSWYWDFGDGETSTKQDPDHTYSEPGSYTVTLTATNDAGSDEKTKYDYITVEGPTTNAESKTDVEPTKDMKSTANTAEKPVAKFSATPKSGITPLAVEFTDKSEGNPTDWYWDFGDGETSYEQNPTHTYSESGTYKAKLTVNNEGGESKKTVTVYVKAPKKPAAKFSATPKSGIEPLTVEFTDKSTGDPTDWYWDFGDGSTSDSNNPVHEYSQAGTYTIRLTVNNDAGSDEEIKSDYITVKEPAMSTESKKATEHTMDPGPTKSTGQKLVADFDAYVPSGTAPFKVVFLDESKGEPTSWYWDFGDGATSTKRDPEHIYSDPGSYSVTLTASNDASSDEKTKYNYITVTAPATNEESTMEVDSTMDTEPIVDTAEKSVAKFSATPKSGITPLTVEFTDKSTENPTEWYWEFGDGESSIQQDPTHTYQEAGSYTVILTVTNDADSDTVTRSNYIRASTKGTPYKVVSRSGLATNTEQTAGGIKESAQDLKITATNLKALQNKGTWEPYGSGELLALQRGDFITHPFLYTLDAQYQSSKTVKGIDALTVADNNDHYLGQCVSLVKALSKTNIVTANWTAGRNVVSPGDVEPGTVIATFNSKGKYYGHAAIFREYIYSEGEITGIKVWDQNYVATKAVGRHDITSGTKKTSNATNYYVVQTLKANDETDSDTKTESKPVAVSSLSGKKIVIDPGHNSTERSRQESKEYEINHKVATKLESLLIAEGANVYLTDKMGDKDEPTIGKRAKSAINEDPDLFISIHTNAAGPTARGVEVWKWSANDKPGFRENELAASIYKNVKKETQETEERYGGKPKETENPWPKGVPILRYSYPCPAILVELDFTTYSSSVTFDGKTYSNMRELMVSTEYQNSAAKALRNSIVDYFT